MIVTQTPKKCQCCAVAVIGSQFYGRVDPTVLHELCCWSQFLPAGRYDASEPPAQENCLAG